MNQEKCERSIPIGLFFAVCIALARTPEAWEPVWAWALMRIVAGGILCLIAALLLVMGISIVWHVFYMSCIDLFFKLRFGLKKDIFLVYSDNEDWKQYIEEDVFSAIGSRAVIYNVSQKGSFSFFKRLMFKRWALPRAYKKSSPLVVLFRPWYKPQVFYLFKMFKRRKYGKLERFHADEEALLKAIHC